jgi:hypothetical protein
MKKLFPLIVCLITLMACKKTKTTEPILEGLWVEKSLRLDTLNFSYNNLFGPAMYLRSAPYTDTVLNPMYPVNHSGIYSYLLSGDSLKLRNFASSSSLLPTYKFSFVAGGNAFTVGKFYNRRELPAVIEFQKIQ